MKLIPITYKIATVSRLQVVKGEAFEHNGNRLCVRKDGGQWVVDDYDSGAYIGGSYDDKLIAIKAAKERLDWYGRAKVEAARMTSIERLRAGGLIE